MACPACDKTMQSVGDWWWCPSCGGVKDKHGGEFELPMGAINVRHMLRDGDGLDVEVLTHYYLLPKERY